MIDSSTAIEAAPGKDDITTQISQENDLTIIDVYSESGIGHLELSSKDEKMATELILRLHVKGLENLTLERAEMVVEASVSSNTPHHISQSTSEAGAEPAALEPSDPLWLNIKMLNSDGSQSDKIPLEDGVFEIAVPPPLLLTGSGDPLFVSWIDFYR